MSSALSRFKAFKHSTTNILGLCLDCSGLENSAHVLDQNGKIYSATLGLVDIVRGTNSYYKLQLLEDDVHKRSVRVTAERDGLHTFTPVDSPVLNTEYKQIRDTGLGLVDG